ncbi:MAG TPA: hypothetical protein VIF14_16615 [Alphaproteobacteria bacterium]|jgi:hypothetical protein
MARAGGGDDRKLGALEGDRLLRGGRIGGGERQEEGNDAEDAAKRKQGPVAEALFRNWWS